MPPVFSTRFLVDALRAAVSNTPYMADRHPEPAELDAAIILAGQNKLTNVISSILEKFATVETSEYLKEYKLQSMVKNASALRELVNVSDLISHSGIRHLIIKGAVQQILIYGNSHVRPTLDIDILVGRKDYEATARLLETSAYKSGTASLWWRVFLGEQHFTKARPPTIVDLHYRLQQPGSPAPKSTERFLAEAETSTILGHLVPHPSARNIRLLSAISIVKGLFNREPVGSHVCDLFYFVKGGVPSALNDLLTLADEQDLTGTVLLALRIVSAVFGVRYEASDRIEAILSSVSSDTLIGMALAPDDPTIDWPRRREILWHLCQKQPLRYGAETSRAVASELARRLFEPDRDQEPARGR